MQLNLMISIIDFGHAIIGHPLRSSRKCMLSYITYIVNIDFGWFVKEEFHQ